MATRRNLDETRQLILDAAAQMVSEAGYSLQSANVSLIDACRRAGLGTAGSGYKIWATQKDFQDDLVRYALMSERTQAEIGAAVLDALAKLEPDPDLTEVIRAASNAEMDAMVGSDWFTRLMALWLAAATEPMMRDEQIQLQALRLTRLGDIFAELLAAYGREMRPPFTIEMLTLAIAAQGNGLGVYCTYLDAPETTMIERSGGADGSTKSWHLLGCVIETLVEAFTQPAEPDDQSGEE